MIWYAKGVPFHTPRHACDASSPLFRFTAFKVKASCAFLLRVSRSTFRCSTHTHTFAAKMYLPSRDYRNDWNCDFIIISTAQRSARRWAWIWPKEVIVRGEIASINQCGARSECAEKHRVRSGRRIAGRWLHFKKLLNILCVPLMRSIAHIGVTSVPFRLSPFLVLIHVAIFAKIEFLGKRSDPVYGVHVRVCLVWTKWEQQQCSYLVAAI